VVVVGATLVVVGATLVVVVAMVVSVTSLDGAVEPVLVDGAEPRCEHATRPSKKVRANAAPARSTIGQSL
jgi:hypothetical protein